MKLYYEILRDLREDREPKTTQKDIAEILHITKQQYQLYESGKRQFKLEHIIKLCEFYGVSADYILGLPKGLAHPDR